MKRLYVSNDIYCSYFLTIIALLYLFSCFSLLDLHLPNTPTDMLYRNHHIVSIIYKKIFNATSKEYFPPSIETTLFPNQKDQAILGKSASPKV